MLLGIAAYLGCYFPPSLLLTSTIATGGDTASHFQTAVFLKETLLSNWRILGWSQGNLAGYPVFQFYFPLPFLLMVLLARLTELEVAFKLVTVLGVFLLPCCTYLAFRSLRFRFPTPALAAVSTLPFLFMEENSVWGGNIPSNLAGEFCYGIGLALMVLFFGTLYRGLLENRGLVGNAILLALVGSSHAYTLLFAVTMSACYPLLLPGIKKNLWYLARLHALTFSLLGFWIVPLLGYSAWTTPFNFIWRIDSWRQVIAPILWPWAAMAAVITLCQIVQLIRRRTTGATLDPRIGLLWCALGLSYLLYRLGYHIDVVDIRFLPFFQLFMVLLATPLLGKMARSLRADWLILALVGLAAVLWTDHHVAYVNRWIDWNYSGFERKVGWPAFERVNEYLRGDAGDARVVYEHSADHNQVGSIRAFESLPLFAGRNTLEGLYLQSSISSPFIFYLQSEISPVASCPLPDYHCAHFDPGRAAEHLEAFNVQQVIARSETLKAALRGRTDFALERAIPPYEVYSVTNNADAYVVPLVYEPVLLETSDWKRDFFSWFKRSGSSDVPLVYRARPNETDLERFAVHSSGLPDAILRQPLHDETVGTEIEVREEIGHHEIRIHTSRPGHPLLVRITYHPRWRLEDGGRVYLASPSFMLIYPAAHDVRLVFSDPPLVRFGQLLSGLGWALVLLNPARRRLNTLFPIRLVREAFTPDRRWLASATTNADRVWLFLEQKQAQMAVVLAAVVILVVLGVVGLVEGNNAQVLYNRGIELFDRGDLGGAAERFSRVITAAPTSSAAMHSSYYLAICDFKQERWQSALEHFQALIANYPQSVYRPEAEYHFALSQLRLGKVAAARATFEELERAHPQTRWARLAREVHAAHQLDVADDE